METSTRVPKYCIKPRVLREPSTTTSWEVTGFRIRTGTPELNSDSLDTDGKMQVPVYVSIEACLKGTDDRYYLTEEELNSIGLIEPGDANNSFPAEWTYSGKEGLFTSSASQAAPSSVFGENNVDHGYQLKRYWVSSTKTEDKNIVARITQPDGKIVTTETSTEVHYVEHAGSTTNIVEMASEVTICRPEYRF